MHCDNCGSDSARHLKIRYMDDPKTKEVFKQETCDVCSSLPNSAQYYRDAAGNRVIVTSPMKYSYAVDAPIESVKQYSEVLKKNNLAQKG